MSNVRSISSVPHEAAGLAQTLCVGIGSPHGDDQIGWLIVDRIAELRFQGVTARRALSPADLLDWLGNFSRLVVCDACRGTGRVGSIHRWVWPNTVIETMPATNSHAFGLSSVLRLAENLGCLPSEVIVWAIEVSDTAKHNGPSDPVTIVLPDVLQRIQRDLCHA